MTLKALIEKAMSERAAKLVARNSIADELAVLRAVESPTDEQIALVSEKRAAKNDIDAEIDALSARIAEFENEQRADEAMDRLAKETVPAAERRAYDEVARVGMEKRTYNPDTDKKGQMFARDVAAAFLGGYESRDRLARHMEEERVERGNYLERAVGTGSFAGLTVPQYLTDLYAPAAAAGRNFANICTKHDLPADGLTVNISRITTTTAAGVQASENTAVTNQDIDDTLLTETMFTVAGQQVMSRQSIDRGVGTEGIVLNDLYRRYHTALDAKLLNDATTGLTNVAQTVAYTDGTPTAAELYPKILNAGANLESVMLDLGVEDQYVVMHSRRWNWLQSQVGTSWPFIAQPGIPTQAGAVNTGGGYNTVVRGVLPNGVKVIVDNNIATNLGVGTNEDEIYFVNAAELHLWEDPSAPVFIRAEQPNAASLGVLLVIYGYAAYSFRRYTNGHQKIAGTGLVAPTF